MITILLLKAWLQNLMQWQEKNNLKPSNVLKYHRSPSLQTTNHYSTITGIHYITMKYTEIYLSSFRKTCLLIKIEMPLGKFHYTSNGNSTLSSSSTRCHFKWQYHIHITPKGIKMRKNNDSSEVTDMHLLLNYIS